MVMIRGGPAGPDPDQDSGSYQNLVEDDRAALWSSLGGKQGILRGMSFAVVDGELELTIAAGAALLSDRDAEGNEVDNRGYHVWADDDVTVSFDAPSSATRYDSLVLAFADTEDGALGTGVDSVGPQFVVVDGASGGSAPSDADITAAIGTGSWMRYADVQIDPSDTEISSDNVVQPDGIYLNDISYSGFVTTASGVATTTENWSRVGRVVEFYYAFNYTGTISVPSTGNIANTAVFTFAVADYPELEPAGTVTLTNGANGALATGVMTSDGTTVTVQLVAVSAGETISGTTAFSLGGTYIAKAV